MTRRTLQSLFQAARSVLPAVSDEDVRALVSSAAARHVPRRKPLPLTPSLFVTGSIMTAVVALILGIVFLGGPKHETLTEKPGDSGSAGGSGFVNPETPRGSADPSASASPDGSSAASGTAADASITPAASNAVPTAATREETGSSQRPDADGVSLDALPMAPYPFPASSADIAQATAAWSSRLPYAAPHPAGNREPVSGIGPDSLPTWKDSVRNYSAFYINAAYSPRSFDDLGTHLRSSGLSLGSGGEFSFGLSYEFPRPDVDAPSQHIFPFYLYSARRIYSPALSFEYLMQPRISAGDGTRSAYFSSLSLFQDNNFFITEGRNSRLALVLSWGVNWTSLTLADTRSFDEILQRQDPGEVTMSKYYCMLRPALRYDHVLFGTIHLGVSAGYTVTLLKGTWRLRSALDTQPGILVNDGPNDSLNGLYLGVHFTMR